MQNLVLRCLDPDWVVQVLETHRPSQPAGFAVPSRWPSRPSYPTTVRISPLRQDLDEGPDFPRYWASKRSDGGAGLEFEWLLVADERDAVDPLLACYLSRELTTIALAVHASEGTDEYGWCSYRKGQLGEQYFREMEERPTYRVNEELEILGIPYKLSLYKDCTGPGWRTLTLDPGQPAG